MYLVFFDLETSGFDPQRHDIIQLAAIAVNGGFETIEEFECKAKFDIDTADRAALEVNSYNPAVWKREAVEPLQLVYRFNAFLRRYASVKKVSKRNGRPYMVAKLAGHNTEGFDRDFFFAWKDRIDPDRKIFTPAEWFTLDTMQMATVLRVGLSLRAGKEYMAGDSLKLADLCERVGIGIDGESHDALTDVRATVALAREMFDRLV